MKKKMFAERDINRWAGYTRMHSNNNNNKGWTITFFTRNWANPKKIFPHSKNTGWVSCATNSDEVSPTFGNANANFSEFIDRIRNQFLKNKILYLNTLSDKYIPKGRSANGTRGPMQGTPPIRHITHRTYK